MAATWEDYIQQQLNADGVQFTWNMWPHSKVDAQRLVVPLAAFFTPLKVPSFVVLTIIGMDINDSLFRSAQLIFLLNRQSNMIRYFARRLLARQSSIHFGTNTSIFGSRLFSFVDYRAKNWTCALCNQRNPFPPHYAAIAENNQPPELYPQFSTIEYTLKVDIVVSD